MPNDGKEFEALVAQVYRSLNDENVTFKEDVKEETDDGEERQIDVLAVEASPPHRVIKGIEAKDEKRSMDLSKFDSIFGKFHRGEGLVPKVAIVNRNGYSQEVVKKAAKYGFELLTLKEAEAFDWLRFLSIPEELTLKSAIQIRSGAKPPIGSDVEVLCSCGKSKGLFPQYAVSIIRQLIRDKHQELLAADDAAARSHEPLRIALNVELSAVSDGQCREKYLVYADGHKEKLERIPLIIEFTRRRQQNSVVASGNSSWGSIYTCGVGVDESKSFDTLGGEFLNIKTQPLEFNQIGGEQKNLVQIKMDIAEGCPVEMMIPANPTVGSKATMKLSAPALKKMLEATRRE